MKRNLFTLLALFTAALAARAQYQFPNSDFEEDFVVSYVSKSYTEPLGWHGYGTISGAVGSMGRSGEKLCQSTDVRSGSTSTKSAYVKSTSILGIVANGVMTNGQIYSNSLSATDGTGNYNFSDPTNTGDADTYGEENNQFYTPFTGRPDSMRVWLKFLPASSGTGNARVSVYLHKANTVMYDPTDNVTDESIIVAHAEQGIPGSDGWVQYTLPFDYDNDGTLGYSGSVRPGLILATFTTNETPGEGSANDYLYIDDIEMVYNSELEGATYAGEDIVFTGNAASVNTLYSSKLLKCTTTGAGASVEKAEPTKDNGYTLTLTVKGDNISEDATNQNTYTIQFAGILEENFENDEVTVPEIVSSTLEDITDDTRLYLYNSYVGGYLNSDNTLLVSPEKYWKVNQTDGTVISEADTYLRIDRDSYSKEFDSSLVPVTSNQTSFGDGMEFTFSQGEGFVEMYRSKMKYYDSEAVIFSTKYYSNVFAGAESMTKLTSYYTGKDTYEETSGVENTKWMLVSPALYLAYYFSCKAETATLKEGVSFNLAVFSDQFDDDVTTMNIGQMPAGIYGFDNGDTFYYDGENTLTISSDATALTYYGILDLRPTITYNGQQAQEEYETAFDESLLTVKATGNGSESPTVYYDPDTYTLTVIVEGYGKANSTVIQFAAPDLSLSATWDGEAIEDGAVLYASYDASKLALTAGEGATVNSLYDEATGVLTITLTASNDNTSNQTYTITFVTPDLALHASLDDTALQGGMTFEGSYNEKYLEIETAEGTTVTYNYTETGTTYVLTITVCAKDDKSLSETYTITFDTPDLSLSATWNGEAVVDGTTLYAAYDADKLMVTSGEGATVTSQYDEATGVLTITVAARDEHDQYETYTITFLTPDLSLNATYGDTTLSDGLTVAGSYKEEELSITAAEGTDVSYQYNNLTLKLTIVVTAKDDDSLSAKYTITFTISTGIDTVNKEAGEDIIYDLSGRRLSQKPTKGIYLINGKKVLAK